ncbi:MAG: PID-CTERM protein-sorting domain-containing protein [Bacteroidales bacterium]
MKKIILTALITIGSIGLFAQPIPPTLPGGGGPVTGHGANGNQGAPIDGGLSILMLLGAVYGAKKVYSFKTKETISE